MASRKSRTGFVPKAGAVAGDGIPASVPTGGTPAILASAAMPDLPVQPVSIPDGGAP